jgi:Flp pilus assembly protein TadG
MVRINPKDPKQKRRGVAAIEFAMVAPLFIFLMLAITVYGGWFWMAHTVQSLAAESARSAIGGLDAAERENLARTLVTKQAPSLGLDPQKTETRFTTTTDSFQVEVIYDARNHPLMALAIMMPKPPALIARTAVVRLEGY